MDEIGNIMRELYIEDPLNNRIDNLKIQSYHIEKIYELNLLPKQKELAKKTLELFFESRKNVFKIINSAAIELYKTYINKEIDLSQEAIAQIGLANKVLTLFDLTRKNSFSTFNDVNMHDIYLLVPIFNNFMNGDKIPSYVEMMNTVLKDHGDFYAEELIKRLDMTSNLLHESSKKVSL